MNSRTWTTYKSERMTGQVSLPEKGSNESKSLLLLLHGVGSNENALLKEGETLLPHGKSISLRAPIQLGRIAFAWFHVKFSKNGNTHNWTEAQRSLALLTEEIKSLSASENIPFDRIFVAGFSQGAIMTLGLYLHGELDLGGYLAFSGRTLAEFGSMAKERGNIKANRSLFLAHGIHDYTLKLEEAHLTRKLIEELGGKLIYKEYVVDHGISDEERADAAAWIADRLTENSKSLS